LVFLTGIVDSHILKMCYGQEGREKHWIRPAVTWEANKTWDMLCGYNVRVLTVTASGTHSYDCCIKD